MKAAKRTFVSKTSVTRRRGKRRRRCGNRLRVRAGPRRGGFPQTRRARAGGAGFRRRFPVRRGLRVARDGRAERANRRTVRSSARHSCCAQYRRDAKPKQGALMRRAARRSARAPGEDSKMLPPCAASPARGNGGRSSQASSPFAARARRRRRSAQGDKPKPWRNAFCGHLSRSAARSRSASSFLRSAMAEHPGRLISARFADNGAFENRKSRGLFWRGDEERGTARVPLVAETEIERRGRARRVCAREVGLRMFCKKRDRPDVSAAVAELPFSIDEKPMRNAGVVLENEIAVREEKVAHLREAVFVHEIRSGLEQAHAAALLFAKVRESGIRFDGPVRQVAGEIIERLLAAGRAEKDDLHARRRALAALDEHT